jgi:hypothetical protein
MPSDTNADHDDRYWSDDGHAGPMFFDYTTSGDVEVGKLLINGCTSNYWDCGDFVVDITGLAGFTVNNWDAYSENGYYFDSIGGVFTVAPGIVSNDYIEADSDIYSNTGDITADLGDISASAGSVSAGTFVDAGTYLQAGTYVQSGTYINAGTEYQIGGTTVLTGQMTGASITSPTTVTGTATLGPTNYGFVSAAEMNQAITDINTNKAAIDALKTALQGVSLMT